MIPLHSDTAARTGTRVDLLPVRAPARSPRATWHSLALATVARLTGHAGHWPPFIISLCRALLGALSALTRMERHCAKLEAAVRLANGRVEFSDRAIAEQQQTIDRLRVRVKDLEAERFEEPTVKRDSSADLLAEAAAFEGQPTVIRR